MVFPAPLRIYKFPKTIPCYLQMLIFIELRSIFLTVQRKLIIKKLNYNFLLVIYDLQQCFLK